jgi:uncharacterized protein (DUF2236 family)
VPPAIPVTDSSGLDAVVPLEASQLGAGSLIGWAWGEWTFLAPFVGRVLALQGMHPLVSAGLEDHSGVFEDPWGRGWDTIRYGLEVIFGDTQGTALEIRQLHRGITGTGYDGRRYHAWNPAAWAWVHLTAFEATLYSLRALGREPTPHELEAMYGEWKAVGRLYGVRAADMPSDVARLHAYVQRGVEKDLVATPTVRRLLEIARSRLPAPPGFPARSLAWPLVRPSAGHLVSVVLAGSFPDVLRRRLAIRWTRRHEAEYQAALAALRLTNAALPDRLKLFPVAHRARP